MTYNELCTELIAKCELGYDYVVKISCAYVSEIYGMYDVYESYEIFTPEANDIIWFNDWYEGQQYCCYDNPLKIEDLIEKKEDDKMTINECLEKLENMLTDCQETMQEEELELLYERLHITIEEAKERKVRK